MRSTVLLLLLTAPIHAADMRVHRDLAYTEPKDSQRTLDLYAPRGGEDHPVVLWIHGGGWRFGDKANVQQKPRAFVHKGYVFVSVNYRFVPQITVGEMTGDIAKAAKWVHSHVKQYGGDPDRVIVSGHSAGAHLAALLCTDQRYLKAEGMSLSDIRGCIPVDTAMYNVAKQIRDRGPQRSQIYTAAFGDNKEVQKELSPIHHVAKHKHIPPFLILHVARRPDATEQSQAFAKMLRAAGVDARVVPGENKTHATINRELGLPDDQPTKAVFEFLEGLLKKDEQPGDLWPQPK